ncbi:MAG: rRNA maturation RNase YbeY [Bacteroidota bacterium]
MLDFLESHFLEEEENVISFFTEDIDFELPQEEQRMQWVRAVIQCENCTLKVINYIFCSDDYLHKINVEYLQHDTLTDIITFPYDEPPIIHSDIFISIDRVRENAKEHQVSFEQELNRVLIHGVLHLCGYKDKGEQEEKLMRQKEDEMLALFGDQSIISPHQNRLNHSQL